MPARVEIKLDPIFGTSSSAPHAAAIYERVFELYAVRLESLRAQFRDVLLAGLSLAVG